MRTVIAQKSSPAPKRSKQANTPRRTHAINSIALELNAATDVRSNDEGTWASFFAIHNLYCGRNRPGKPLPISVRFGGNSVAYVLAAMRKGGHFTVTGRLDYAKGEDGKEWYRISAEQIRIHSRRDRTPAKEAA
jgi:hypothetical protein